MRFHLVMCTLYYVQMSRSRRKSALKWCKVSGLRSSSLPNEIRGMWNSISPGALARAGMTWATSLAPEDLWGILEYPHNAPTDTCHGDCVGWIFPWEKKREFSLQFHSKIYEWFYQRANDFLKSLNYQETPQKYSSKISHPKEFLAIVGCE